MRSESLSELLRILAAENRPELVWPLLPAVERCSEPPPWDRLGAMTIAREAADKSAPRRLLEWFLVARRWHHLAAAAIVDDARLAGELIEAGEASIALRVLQAASRGRGRAWMERLRPRQLVIAGRALQALHRDEAARHCYQRVLDRADSSDELAHECQRRMAALDVR